MHRFGKHLYIKFRKLNGKSENERKIIVIMQKADRLSEEQMKPNVVEERTKDINQNQQRQQVQTYTLSH